MINSPLLLLITHNNPKSGSFYGIRFASSSVAIADRLWCSWSGEMGNSAYTSESSCGRDGRRRKIKSTSERIKKWHQ